MLRACPVPGEHGPCCTVTEMSTAMTQTPELPRDPMAAYWAVPVQPSGGAGAPMAYGHRAPTMALASPWLRLAALLINMVLFVVTFGVGYLVVTLFLWRQGTNAGKRLLGLRVVKADTGRTCGFGDMLVRNVVVGWFGLSILGALTFSIGHVVDALMVFGDRRQRLTDKVAGTLVVQD